MNFFKLPLQIPNATTKFMIFTIEDALVNKFYDALGDLSKSIHILFLDKEGGVTLNNPPSPNIRVQAVSILYNKILEATLDWSLLMKRDLPKIHTPTYMIEIEDVSNKAISKEFLETLNRNQLIQLYCCDKDQTVKPMIEEKQTRCLGM